MGGVLRVEFDVRDKENKIYNEKGYCEPSVILYVEKGSNEFKYW